MTIEFRELREFPVKSLRLPGDFRKRYSAEHIGQLSERMKHRGQIVPLLVRDTSVLDGVDRVAAALRAGIEMLWANVITCTDLEAEIIMREAQMHRRHDPAEQRRLADELIPRYAQEIAETRIDPEKPNQPPKQGVQKRKRSRGRKKGVRSEAISRVAAELGVSAEALLKSDYRRRKKGELPDPPFALKDLGMDLPPEFKAQASEAGKQMERAARYVAMAVACMTEVTKLGANAFPSARLQRLHQDASDLSASIRNAKPVSVCPCCKALVKLRPGCAGCSGSAIMLANQQSAVPKELLDELNPLVLAGGKFHSVWDFIDQDEKPEGDDLDSLFGGQ